MNRNNNVVTRHLHFKHCRGPLNVGLKVAKQCPCKASGPQIKNFKAEYFLRLDLFAQLSELFQDKSVQESLLYRFTRKKANIDFIEDIYDGEMYRQLCMPGNFLSDPDHLSFTINTDGCEVSKSSKASTWPIYLQINDPPPPH